MNIAERQLYFAGLFNEYLGCGGVARAEKIAELDDSNFELLQKAFAELWPLAQDCARLYSIGGRAQGRLPHISLIRDILDEDWREWRSLLAGLSEPEWSELQRALHLFRQSCRRAAA